MSNFIHGRIVVNNLSQVKNSEFDFSIIEFCARNKFALRFVGIFPKKDVGGHINFQISDNFLVNYCESFMEPIIYTIEDTPLD